MKKIYMIITILAVAFGLFCIDLQNFNNGETFGNIRAKINNNNDTLDVHINNAEQQIIELNRLSETISASAGVSDSTYTVLTANTFEPLSVVFTNVLLDRFTLNTDKIVYQGSSSDSVFVQIIGTISMLSNKNNSLVTFAITKNDEIIPFSEISRGFTVGNVGNMVGLCWTWLKTGDEISIVVKSDVANNELGFLNIRTSVDKLKWSDR